MFTKIIEPRFSETDALGHINNNVYSVWFEVARRDIFKAFNPNFSIDKLDLIMAHISCDFLNEVFYGKDVVIKTAISKIGNSSFDVTQALYQENKLCTLGKAVVVHYDHNEKKSLKLEAEKREFLEKNLFLDTWKKSLD